MTDTANHVGGGSVLSELRIVLLGSRYSGKSSTGNTILGREGFGDTTAECVSQEVFGRKVTVVEVPAWRGRYLPLESLETTRRRLDANLSLCLPGPHALLMVIPLETIRGKEWLVEEFLEYPIQSVWDHTIVLIMGGDALGDTNIETLVHKEVGELIRRCGHRYHVMNNKDRGYGHQVEALQEKIEQMEAAHGGRCFKALEQNLQLLGEDLWQSSLVLFGMGPGYDFDEVSVEEHIESWKELRWVVDRCGNRYHVLDMERPVGQGQVVELLEKVEEMVASWDHELLLEALERSEERNAELKALCSEQQRAMQQMEEMIEDHVQEMELLTQESGKEFAGVTESHW